MIQDIDRGAYSNAYAIKEPGEGDLIYFFRDGKVLSREGTLAVPEKREAGEGKYTFLFSVSGRDRYLSLEARDIAGYAWQPVGVFRTLQPRDEAFALVTAWHLYNWYKTNRFCGACGHENEPGKTERSLVCPVCGATRYPVISPAVIVGVTQGDRIVLTRYRGRPGKPAALVAGFAEIGEALEDTIRREVKEETGLSVGRVRYYASQPWGLSQSLLAGFFAELDGSDRITVQEDELDCAVWVRREDIDVEDDGVSLTREMIRRFREGPVFI